MKQIFFFIFFLSCLMLGGCQSNKAALLHSVPRAAHTAFPTHWQASGRIGAFTKQHGGSLGFQLKNNNKAYQLRFMTPTGGQVALLEGNGSEVTLFLEDGQQEHDKSPEALLQKRIGWSVPILGLRYWILGLIDPKNPVQAKSYNTDGTLASLEQNGWHISFENYLERKPYVLPSRLTLLHLDPSLKLKIAVSTWEPL